jgi:hypothetical protein
VEQIPSPFRNNRKEDFAGMHKAIALAVFLFAASGCVILEDSGPVETASRQVDSGSVEAVRADIRMSAGELNIRGGGGRLLDASFRYSRRLGKPEVSYDATGFRGRLTVESPKNAVTTGNITNEWSLTFGDKTPLDLNIHMGAGEGKLDLSSLPLRNLEAKVGAGEFNVNLAGNYTRDVSVQIHGGVGSAKIKLPGRMSVMVDAKGGIGSINAHGLVKKGDRYYSENYDESKPTIRLEVRGGIGEITLETAG